MRIIDWGSLPEGGRREALARPAADRSATVDAEVRAIVDTVRRDGLPALLEYTRRFSGANLATLEVNEAEFAAADRELPPAAIAAIDRAIANVERFHAAQGTPPLSVEVEPGVVCEQVTRPISAVGLYVPAGSAPLPSTAIMLAVPARLAGCRERVVCSPPRADGSLDPAILVAARRAGVTRVFKLGGAQAIAALAYGIAPVPKVDKIFGPGSAWVTAAKQVVASDPSGAAQDLPAGPSEVMILADDSAQPAWTAADLLAQAEHDVLAQAILVSSSPRLTREVAAELERQWPVRSRGEILRASVRNIRLIDVPDLQTAVAVAEAYAPEHLLLQTRSPRDLLAGISSAGSVFIGSTTPETMGDYCSGANHVLPTYGYARAFSGLSLADFQRRMTVQELTPDGLAALGPSAVILARLEGLDGHAAAVELRLSSARVA